MLVRGAAPPWCLTCSARDRSSAARAQLLVFGFLATLLHKQLSAALQVSTADPPGMPQLLAVKQRQPPQGAGDTCRLTWRDSRKPLGRFASTPKAYLFLVPWAEVRPEISAATKFIKDCCFGNPFRNKGARQAGTMPPDRVLRGLMLHTYSFKPAAPPHILWPGARPS